jgi:hypothetical protein
MGIWADKSQPPAAELELPEGATSLTLLQAVYRAPELPLPTRMRAAAIAIAYEHPKLAVTAIIGSDDLAERLDRAIARANGTASATKVIEASPVREPLPPTGPRPTPLGAPFPTERHRRA